jgi:hypothetical protein
MYVLPCSFSRNTKKKESSKDYSGIYLDWKTLGGYKLSEGFVKDILTVEEEKSVLKRTSLCKVNGPYSSKVINFF